MILGDDALSVDDLPVLDGDVMELAAVVHATARRGHVGPRRDAGEDRERERQEHCEPLHRFLPRSHRLAPRPQYPLLQHVSGPEWISSLRSIVRTMSAAGMLGCGP